MKEGWIVKKLGEIFETQSGGTPLKTHKEYYEEGNIPWLRSGEVCKKYIQDTEMYITSLGLENSSAKYFPIDTVVVAMYGATAGQVGILKLETTTNQAICGIFPREDYIPEFLYYVLHSKYYELVSQAIGNAQPNISQNKIRNLYIPIVDYSEQHRIVSELDCLNEIIDKKREQLKELNALAQSIFYDMFGDPDHTVYEVVALSNLTKYKLSYGSGASATSYDGNIRYVRITDIGDDGVLLEKKVSPTKVEDKYILNDGDVLFARSGATVGKTFLYESKYGKCIYAGYLIRYVADREKILPKYLFYYTKTLYYKSFIKTNAQAVAQPNINAQQYGNLKVCVPPLSLQQEFAEKISAIDKQKELIKQSLAEVENLFNSRMNYYFH